MYKETLTALLDLLNGITINGRSNLAYEFAPDKTGDNIACPRISVELYDEQRSGIRDYCDQYHYFDSDSDITDDSTSAEYVEAPQAIDLYYQIEAETRRKHDDYALREAIQRTLGKQKNITITFTCGGHSIPVLCGLTLVSFADMHSGELNMYQGRAVYSYKIESWLWPDVDTPPTVPLLQERILNRYSDPDFEDLIYTNNLDS